MNANSALDEIDEYVDALLGNTVEAPVALSGTDAAPPVASEVAVEATVSTGQTVCEVTTPACADAAEARPAAPIDTPATAPAIPAAAFRPITPAAPVRTSSTQASNRWLRVAVGSDSYALELLCVQEVVRVAPIVAMRGANPAVLGVMNLRGRIVPVFDLGLWLGTVCVQPDERSRIVVVERDDELIGVLVTLVEDVVTLVQERIEAPLPGSKPGPIVGIARVGMAPTVLLDAAALFG